MTHLYRGHITQVLILDMINPITLYSGSVGFNNKISPYRLPFSMESGVSAFENSMDIFIDRTGRAVSRRPLLLSIEGNFNSIYKINNESFYIVENRGPDAALFMGKVFNNSINLTGVRSNLSKLKMSYFPLGGRVRYSNGIEKGILLNGESKPWPVNIWTGPKTDRVYSELPMGTHIEMFNGRAIVLVDDEIFYSEYGLPNLTDLARNRRRFGSKLIMVKSVQTGLFISDEKAIYFLSGRNPKNWKVNKVASYPAVEWAVEQELVSPHMFGYNNVGLACIIGTINGPIIGFADGSISNQINKSVTVPYTCGNASGAVMVVDETMIIQSGE